MQGITISPRNVKAIHISGNGQTLTLGLFQRVGLYSGSHRGEVEADFTGNIAKACVVVKLEGAADAMRRGLQRLRVQFGFLDAAVVDDLNQLLTSCAAFDDEGFESRAGVLMATPPFVLDG